MQIDVKTLIPSPINPGVIDLRAKRLLTQSLLTFTKMIQIRPLIVTKANVVLSGNQRSDCYIDILTLTGEDIRIELADNLKYQALTSAEQDELIEYWNQWRKNPMVPVLVSELPEDREKELIIKDNLAYGTFDMELLNEQYSREELLLYDVINDEMKQLDPSMVLPPGKPGGKPREVDVLRFGDISVGMTRDDYDQLKEKFDRHTEKTGTSYGFVTAIKKQYEL